ELFADLGRQHPPSSAPMQQPTEPFFASTVRGRRIQQIDPEIVCGVQQAREVALGRKLEPVWITNTLVPAELHRTEPQQRDLDTGTPKHSPDHPAPHGGVAIGTECASEALEERACTGSPASAASTRSPRSGANASLVGQQTSTLPHRATKLAWGGTMPGFKGSARPMARTRKSASRTWSHGKSSASSRLACAICSGSPRPTPSAA